MPGFNDLRIAVNQQPGVGVIQHPHQVVGIILVLVGIFPVQFLDHPRDRIVGVGKIGAAAEVGKHPPFRIVRLLG